MKYITKEQLETSRTPTELDRWVKNKIEEIGSSTEGKSAIRLKKGLVKELVEELLPLGKFAIKHFPSESEITISPVIGSQRYDATVQGDEDGIVHIEITQAHEGEGEHLRMLELEDKGHVSATGPISKQGTKKTGINVSIESIARGHKDIKGEIFDRIQQATIRKCEKDYPAKTALVVMFDDYLSLTEEDVVELDDLIKKNLLPKLQKFALVSFISWNEKWYLEYPCQEE